MRFAFCICWTLFSFGLFLFTCVCNSFELGVLYSLLDFFVFFVWFVLFVFMLMVVLGVVVLILVLSFSGWLIVLILFSFDLLLLLCY